MGELILFFEAQRLLEGLPKGGYTQNAYINNLLVLPSIEEDMLACWKEYKTLYLLQRNESVDTLQQQLPVFGVAL